MITLTPQMRILVARDAVDFRCGIDRLAQICRAVLSADPMSGGVFVFRNRKGTSVKLLMYDGQGFWLCQKRLSAAKFKHWPDDGPNPARLVLSVELGVLLSGGDPKRIHAAPQWRPIVPGPPPCGRKNVIKSIA